MTSTGDAAIADRRVLFVGDSFVAGVGDPTGLGWVGRVVAGAHTAGHPLTAYNLGVRRETSTDVAARWPGEARPRLTADAEARMVLAFGVNDTTIEGGRPRVAPATSVANLTGAIDAAADLELPLLIVGPPPVADAAQRARIEALSLRFADVAASRGIPFVDAFGPLSRAAVWDEELRAGDGAHPGSAGYALLAELVMDPWLAWLETEPVDRVAVSGASA
jgi:lysophospholipase L1-like esterase